MLTSGAGGRGSSVRVTPDPAGDATGLLKLGVARGGTETTGGAALRPANGTYLLGDGAVAGATLAVTLGSDGTTPQDNDYIAAFALLDPLRDVNLVAVPGIGTAAVRRARARPTARTGWTASSSATCPSIDRHEGGGADLRRTG